MSKVITFIKNLKVAHKIAIVALALGCLAFSNNDISRHRDFAETSLKFNYEQCERDNPNNSSAREKCQLSESEKNKKIFEESVNSSIIYNFIICLILFPLYLIIYNTFFIIKNGYRNLYDFSKMSKPRKVLHYTGIAYLSITLLILIVYHEDALVTSKIGNHLPSKNFSYADLKEFGGENSETLTVEGVWTSNGIPIKNLKFKDINFDNYVTKIDCWKEKGTCDHAIGNVTIGEDFPLTQVDYQESEIEFWGKDKIIAVQNSTCVKTIYTFNLKSELVTRETVPSENANYRCGEVEPSSFTLSDGVEVGMEIRKNEIGPVSRFIGYIVSSIF